MREKTHIFKNQTIDIKMLTPSILLLSITYLVQSIEVEYKALKQREQRFLSFSSLTIDYKGPNKLKKEHFDKFLLKNNTSTFPNPDILNVLILNRFNSHLLAKLASKFASRRFHFKPNALITGYTLLKSSKFSNAELLLFKKTSSPYQVSKLRNEVGLCISPIQLIKEYGVPVLTFTINNSLTIRVAGILLSKKRNNFFDKLFEINSTHEYLQTLPPVHQVFLIGNFNFETVVSFDEISEKKKKDPITYSNYWADEKRKIRKFDLSAFQFLNPEFKDTNLPTSGFKSYSKNLEKSDQLQLLMSAQSNKPTYIEEPITFQPNSGLNPKTNKYSGKTIPSYNNRALMLSTSNTVGDHMNIDKYDIMDFEFLRKENLSVFVSGRFNIDQFSKGKYIKNRFVDRKYAHFTLEWDEYFEWISLKKRVKAHKIEANLRSKNQQNGNFKLINSLKGFSKKIFSVRTNELVESFDANKSWVELELEVIPFFSDDVAPRSEFIRITMFIDKEVLEGK